MPLPLAFLRQLAVNVVACVLAWPCKQPVIIRHAHADLWPFYDSSQCRSLCTGLAVQTASGHPTCPCLLLAFLRQK